MTIGSRRQQLADATRWWALLQTLSVYWGSIWPVARAEIERWRRRSTRIPDPELRSNAIATIAEEHLNAESAAVFAVLARTGARAAPPCGCSSATSSCTTTSTR
jgi:hypothetical protein